MVAFIAAGAGEPTDDGNGSPLGDGIWETEADWTVEAGQSPAFENLTIVINGNLSIEFGGTLTLMAVELVVNVEGDEQHWIRVGTTAELVMTDLDGDASTTADRSEIGTRFDTDRIYLVFDGGSKATITRSRLSNLGQETGAGMEVLSDDVHFEDVVVETFSSVLVDEADPVFRRTRFTGDGSSLYFSNSSATLDGCTIINCYEGISALGSPAPIVSDTAVVNCFLPLHLVGATLTMSGGILESTTYGSDVYLNSSSHATLVDVDFSNDKVIVADPGSDLKVRWTLDLKVTDQEYQPLEDATVEVDDGREQRVFTGSTDMDGMVPIELLDYFLTATEVDSRNPHTIRVSKGRYHGVVAMNVTETMARELSVMTNIKPVIGVVSPLQGTRVVMGQSITFNASTTYDPNGDTMTFNWTTNIGDRLLYSGPSPVMTASLLLGESKVTLEVSDGEGGVNTTILNVVVLQASQAMVTLKWPQYIATLVAVYGGEGDILLNHSDYPKPHAAELIGVFISVHTDGDAILASGDLEVDYQPELIPYGMDEMTIVIAKEDGGIWLTVPSSSVDVEGHVVTAKIGDFGLYAVMGVMPPNIPPRIRLDEGGELVPPHDFEYVVGDEVDITFSVDDELPNFAVMTVVDLPDFLRLDSSTKRVWGTAPGTSSSNLLDITITDIGGLSDRVVLWLNVSGELTQPQLWSGIVDPDGGDYTEVYEIKVLYRSMEDLPPEYVRLVVSNESYEMIPVDPSDDNYLAGVMYYKFLEFGIGDFEIYFETSDGQRGNQTTVALDLEVTGRSFQPSSLEMIIILVTVLAIIIILAIIHMTSERYNRLKNAHLGKDREDILEYIKPGSAPAEKDAGPDEGDDEEGETGVDELDEDPAMDGEGDEEPEHVLDVDNVEMEMIDSDVERLEAELDELDGEIDHEEEELAKIDEEIEEIIDELDDDRERAT